VNKTDWYLRAVDGRLVLTRYEPPIALWMLDRWFRIPDWVFDLIEWKFPHTSSITRVPCLLYSRWLPKLIVRRKWSNYDVTERSDEPEVAPST
jgi:hypothetical protein